MFVRKASLKEALTKAATADDLVFVEIHTGRMDCHESLRSAGQSITKMFNLEDILTMSTNTFPYWKLAPNAFSALNKFTETLETGSVDKKLKNLIYLRISQINGCAYCTELHGRDLRKDGETAERIDTLAAWKESSHFTHDERLALRWAEAVTYLKDQQVPKELFNELKTSYTDTQIAELTFAIASINAWNRIAISMHRPV